MFLFAQHGRIYEGCQIFLGASRSQRIPQRNFPVPEEADFQISVGGDPEAVARPTEVFAHRSYEAHLSSVTRHLPRLKNCWRTTRGNRTHRVSSYLRYVVRSVAQRSSEIGIPARDYIHDVFVRHHFIQLPAVSGERHVFDEANVDVPVFRELDEIQNFVVVEALHEDAVDLHRIVIQLQGEVDSHHDSLPSFPPGDFFVSLRLERVQTDVQQIQTGSLERDQQARQNEAVRRYSDALQTFDALQRSLPKS